MVLLFDHEVEQDDGSMLETTTEFPAHAEVCSRCNGKGKHDHPAFANGITGSEWSEWDQDEREGYMSGRYDVTCEECNGKRVVLALSLEWDDPALATYREWCEQEQASRLERDAERRMGC